MNLPERLSRIFTRPLATFFAIWLGLFLAATAWAFSTPLSGGPDEPAHIVKAASVVRGQFLGDQTDEGAVRMVTVPESIALAHSWPCFAFHPELAASCVTGDYIGTGKSVQAPTSAGLYNPVFYLLVGWPSLLVPDNGAAAVYGMRLVGAFFTTGFLAVGVLALTRLRASRFTALGAAAAITPMVLFLTAVVNPNAVEVAAALALIGSLFRLLSPEPLTRRWPWLFAVAVSGALLPQARGLSPLWVVLIAAIVLTVVPWATVIREVRRPAGAATVAIVAVASLCGVAWTLYTGSLGSLGSFPGADNTPFRAFVNMLSDYIFSEGIIGNFGWLDTPAPGFVYLTWSLLIGAVIVTGLSSARGRALAGQLVAAAGVVLLPAVVQAASISTSGYIWQGRYALAAYVCLIATVVAVTRVPALDGALRSWADRAVWIVASAVVIGYVWSIVETLRRNQGGVSVIDLLLRPEWSPPGGVVIWIILEAIGVVIAAFVLIRATERPGLPYGAVPSAATNGG
ncbi:hypothetical protein DCE93_09710 [Agromyces badenianii]|uniref:DUF2142 domain-containing protein n=1 Tax=Agromyces badenianii TaxID=2080742 RepID=A0A2S0WX32_9MICO|nr:DUF2142 domain-containing protein [Agromyces badenianii]AWB95903.1 hypothetical protein DCE93_09710 [Agromyces badenianii]